MAHQSTGCTEDMKGMDTLSAPEDSIIRKSSHVAITEQPARFIRIRYGSSETSFPKIVGANHSPSTPSYPTIQISGLCGTAKIVISCVTIDEACRPHPNELKGQPHQGQPHPNELQEAEYHYGILIKKVVLEDNMSISFPNLHLSHTKKDNIKTTLENRLKGRLELGIASFTHSTIASPSTKKAKKDLRLCFELFGEKLSPDNTLSWQPLAAVVSDPITPRKSKYLRIFKFSHTTASVAGGQEVMIFCDEIEDINDIKVIFFDKSSTWEEEASFIPSSDIHKKCGICFKTPAYFNQEISEPLKVFVQLRQRSDSAPGEEYPFTLTPHIFSSVERKKRKLEQTNFCEVLKDLVLEYSLEPSLKPDVSYGQPPAPFSLDRYSNVFNFEPESPTLVREGSQKTIEGEGPSRQPDYSIPEAFGSSSDVLPTVNQPANISPSQQQQPGLDSLPAFSQKNVVLKDAIDPAVLQGGNGLESPPSTSTFEPAQPPPQMEIGPPFLSEDICNSIMDLISQALSVHKPTSSYLQPTSSTQTGASTSDHGEHLEYLQSYEPSQNLLTSSVPTEVDTISALADMSFSMSDLENDLEKSLAEERK